MESLLRPATEHDLPRIVEIYNSTIPLRTVTADLEPVTVDERMAWLTGRDGARHPVMVFQEDDEVAGWWALQPFNERAAYDCTAEISIYIDQRFRGRGLGTRAITSAVEHAKQVGIDRILGKVFTHNEASKKMMTVNGFTVWGTLEGVTILDGVRRDVLIYGIAI